MNDEQAQKIGRIMSQAVRDSQASIAALAAAFRRIYAIAPTPDQWVLTMRPETYSRLLPMSRKKLQPYVRKAWRKRR